MLKVSRKCFYLKQKRKKRFFPHFFLKKNPNYFAHFLDFKSFACELRFYEIWVLINPF